LYRALDAVADAKDEIEAHCFIELCNLANLDLRLVCYDLTSTYFEGEEKSSARFPTKAFGLTASAAITGTIDRLIALADRVRSGRLVDPAKIGAAPTGPPAAPTAASSSRRSPDRCRSR
jgi:hypothetical protein